MSCHLQHPLLLHILLNGNPPPPHPPISAPYMVHPSKSRSSPYIYNGQTPYRTFAQHCKSTPFLALSRVSSSLIPANFDPSFNSHKNDVPCSASLVHISLLT
ncbi:hypothetical protein SPOG_03033 [Schizosaccharomyces cryophilus OY26]|uniref:Uncharacterized protein n=1 Tax=Schizosaccharomyces cryophilus (strain OY26 / ATCC MYA-4695 / CBS 11777 / NBRC 106824 / NRRL Y48691) TaxID=653667 RepID=S9W5A1_SCHCR|nr:uncharacterized protein SPOG_03033 [Schizosaccharomyces cryophilus OY26]EPY53734.1 hypothetical protein SPOG_03033 [Schizosaccharomyces cryophilus OY26]